MYHYLQFYRQNSIVLSSLLSKKLYTSISYVTFAWLESLSSQNLFDCAKIVNNLLSYSFYTHWPREYPKSKVNKYETYDAVNNFK